METSLTGPQTQKLVFAQGQQSIQVEFTVPPLKNITDIYTVSAAVLDTQNNVLTSSSSKYLCLKKQNLDCNIITI